MRILLDESAPSELRELLADHDVETVPERGWRAKENGELLTLAVGEGFDAFVTPDQNIPHQQNLASFDIAVVILAAGRNRRATYEPVAGKLRELVEGAPRGEVTWFRG